MDFSDKEINNHFAKEMIKEPHYWLKNEILLNPQPYLDKATLVGKKKSDSSHNKKKKNGKIETGNRLLLLLSSLPRRWFHYLSTRREI